MTSEKTLISSAETTAGRRWRGGRRRRAAPSASAGVRAATALIAAVSLLGASLFAAAPASAAALNASGPDCRTVAVPVGLHPGEPRSYTVSGRLCVPSGQQPETVQLLLHGATYSRTYWDWDQDPGRYSYVAAATSAGYATLAVDRIGHGQSSHPLSALVDTSANAFTAHQVVQALRDGELGYRFTKIISVGHSYGSITALEEAAQYGDVSATILSGMLHKLTVVGTAMVATAFLPAGLDDPGYLTTRPGVRATLFYNAAMADPQVIAHDEATKDTLTATELATFPLTLVDGSAARVHVPVLLAVGEKDTIFCGLGGADCSSAATVQAQEAAYYRPPACTPLSSPTPGTTSTSTRTHPTGTTRHGSGRTSTSEPGRALPRPADRQRSRARRPFADRIHLWPANGHPRPRRTLAHGAGPHTNAPTSTGVITTSTRMAREPAPLRQAPGNKNAGPSPLPTPRVPVGPDVVDALTGVRAYWSRPATTQFDTRREAHLIPAYSVVVNVCAQIGPHDVRRPQAAAQWPSTMGGRRTSWGQAR